MTATWTEEDSFEARLAHATETPDPYPGCYRTKDCNCAPCEWDRAPFHATHRVEWTGGLLVNHTQPQCPCETTGRTTAACPWHGPETPAAPQTPRGWE